MLNFEKQNRNGKGVKSFYFNKNGSNGKYLAGIIKVELPYETLDGILKPEYLPAEPAGGTGELTIRSEAGECHRIPITIEREISGEKQIADILTAKKRLEDWIAE